MSFKSFFNRCNYQLVSCMLLGFSAGIPLALTGSTLSMWLSRIGIDIQTIGLFSLVAIPFSCKFLWAFLFDNIQLPYFSKRFGFRKSWLILSQICLILSIIALGQTSPLSNIALTAIMAFLVCCCSATQDIIIDALRIEMLKKEEQGMAVSLYVYGYRLAMIFSGAGSLILADYLPWKDVFLIMGLSVVVGVVTVFFIKEPEYSKLRIENTSLESAFSTIIISPIIDLFKHKNFIYIALFIIFGRISDSLLSSVQSNFYVFTGFSNSEIAYITKGLGFIMTLFGMFIGGSIYYKFGIFRSLIIATIMQIVTNLFFILVSKFPHNIPILSVVIAAENFAGAISMVVIVAYLSSLCNIQYTAAQYALLSSLANIGRTFIAAPAGFLVNYFGWVNFFWITALVGVPAIFLIKVIFKERENDFIS
jgi:MFS transporter, PAT family, beta-lactamase induction signal transducer AmpG